MGSERGSAALAVIGAVALATLVGVGVYTVIKDRRLAAADTDTPAAAAAPAAVPVPVPAEPAPTPEPEPPPPQPQPVDVAEANAVDPVGNEPPKTNAPTFGTPGIEGQLAPEGVASAVRATSPRLQRCFETRLATGAKIGGTLRVRLVVNRRGGVTTATAEGFDDGLAICVTSVLRDVRLPRTKDGGTATVVYPIAFQEVQAADPDCDEVSCVLDNYERPCCARFKPGARPPASGAPDSVSREELSEVLRALRPAVTACATREGFVGMVKVKFKVLPNGEVGAVTIPDVEPELAACVARAFKTLTFTATTNGVTASFPFRIAGE